MKSNLIISGIIPLWQLSYYDGVLEGVLDYKAEKCYFSLRKQYKSKKLLKNVYRTFDIYRLTPEQWKMEKYWNDEFRLHCGSQTSYIWDKFHKYYTVDNWDGGNDSRSDTEYTKEMFHERYEKHLLNNPLLVAKMQKIGWCSYGVLEGLPHVEWRKKK